MSNANEPLSSQLGILLREMREEKNISRKRASEYIGVSQRHLSAIELGEKYPSVETLYRLVRYFAAPANRLFYPELNCEDSQIEEIQRLVATCTPKQRQLIAAFVKMLREQPELEL